MQETTLKIKNKCLNIAWLTAKGHRRGRKLKIKFFQREVEQKYVSMFMVAKYDDLEEHINIDVSVLLTPGRL